MLKAWAEVCKLDLGKKLDEKYSRRIVLRGWHKLEGKGAISIEKLPSDIADDLEEYFLNQGLETYRQFDNYYELDCVWAIWEDCTLAKKKEIVLALYEITRPLWEGVVVRRLF